MFELNLLHAASRSKKVYLRNNEGITVFDKRDGESKMAFLRRLQQEKGGSVKSSDDVTREKIDFAALFRGDVELPNESKRYVLFPEKVAANISASDLLSTEED